MRPQLAIRCGPENEKQITLVTYFLVVRTEEVETLFFTNALHEGAGETVPLKRNGYFERRPHLKSQANVIQRM